MSKHTAAPWEFVESREYGYSTLWNPETREEILTPDGRNDGDSPITWMGEGAKKADLALILAAPDLLDALEAILRYPGERSIRENARAAIAKAKGQP